MHRDRIRYSDIHQQLREAAMDRSSDASTWRVYRDAKSDTLALLSDSDASSNDAERNLSAIQRHLVDNQVAQEGEFTRHFRRAA